MFGKIVYKIETPRMPVTLDYCTANVSNAATDTAFGVLTQTTIER